MTHFVIKATPDTPNAEGERFDFATIDAAVDDLSGRPGIAAYVLPKLHGDKARVYVAADRRRGKCARRGFIVEVVREARP